MDEKLHDTRHDINWKMFHGLLETASDPTKELGLMQNEEP